MKNSIATVGMLLTSLAWAWSGSSCGFGAAQNRQPGERAMAQAEPRKARTHGADRLKDFYLAEEVDVSGLGLTAALGKLRKAYEDTCLRTGEVPLKLAFEVPAGHEAPLRVKPVGERTLEASIRCAAAGAKLTVERDGANYRFKAPQETGELVKKTFGVPPDLVSRLTGKSSGVGVDPRTAFQQAGLDLGESTRLAFAGPRTNLALETRSAADDVAVTSMVKSMVGDPPRQLKFEATVFEFPSDANGPLPAGGGFDEKTAKRLLDGLGKRGQVKKNPMPEVTARSNEEAVIDITAADSMPQNRKVILIKASLLGLGQHLATSFTETTRKPGADGDKRTSIRDVGFTPDTGTRFATQTRADGSKVVIAVTSTTIDATGRPISAGRD